MARVLFVASPHASHADEEVLRTLGYRIALRAEDWENASILVRNGAADPVIGRFDQGAPGESAQRAGLIALAASVPVVIILDPHHDHFPDDLIAEGLWNCVIDPYAPAQLDLAIKIAVNRNDGCLRQDEPQAKLDKYLSPPDSGRLCKSQMRALSKSTEVIAFSVDKDHRYLHFTEGHRLEMLKNWGVHIEKGNDALNYILDPHDRERARTNFTRALSGEEFRIVEQCGPAALTRNYYENIYFPVRDHNGDIVGVSVFATDVSAGHESESAFRAGERRFRTVIEEFPLGVSLLGPDLTFKYVNPRFTEIFGYTAQDLPDKEAWFRAVYKDETYRNQVKSRWIADFESSAFPESRSIRVHLTTKPGSEILCDIKTTILNDGRYLQTYEDVTDRARLQSELEAARADWEETFDAIPDLIAIMDDQKRIIRANAAMSAALEIEKADLVGARCFRLLHRPPFPPNNCPLATAKETRLPHTHEIHLETLNKDFLVAATPILNESGQVTRYVHVATDISDRVKAEREVKKAYEILVTTLRSCVDAVIIGSLSDGKLLFVNDEFRRLTGYTEAELMSEHAVDLPIWHDLGDGNCALDRIRKLDRPVNIECKMRRKDGETVSCIFSTTVFTVEGEQRWLGIIKNIEDMKKAELDRIRIERLESVTALAHGVAHHFNNMLQVLSANAEMGIMSLDDNDLDETRRSLEIIFETSKQGSGIVKRINAFAGWGSKGKSCEVSWFDLSNLAAQAVEMTSVWWKVGPGKRGMPLRIESEFIEAAPVFGAEAAIFEVILSLIRNAVEALPGGGRIRIETLESNGELLLKVADNGPGIPREHMNKIFDPFFTTKGLQRAGMGLSGCLAVVKAHGGAIDVVSGPYGTVITVKLPKAPDDERRSSRI